MSSAQPGSDRIAFIQASWHSELVDGIREGFIGEIGAFGFPEEQVDVFRVPGAFEIPLHAKRLAEGGGHVAIVAAGLVVDGGIYRHEFVAGAVIDGLMRVQLDTGIPVFSVVLTPHHFHEHEEHLSYFARHLVTKGAEGARACGQTLESLRTI